jgi:hypothetical protein
MSGMTAPLRVSGNVVIAASTVSASAPLAGAGDVVLVTNLAASPAFVAFGGSSIEAAPASIPVPAGGRLLLNIGFSTYAAAVLASGTGNVHFTSGDGDTY